MKHELPALPYAPTALEGYISEETFSYHHGKHHAAYVNNLNKLVVDTPFADMSLEDVIKGSEFGKGVFNNAAQHWNHSFFWNCLSPNGGGAPKGKLVALIESKWGSYDKFKEEFSQSAVTLFGSGWAWLAKGEDGSLEILPLKDADTPLRHGKTPLLTLDVWEHAYYIDYRNARPKFVEGFWDVVNWDFATRNYG